MRSYFSKKTGQGTIFTQSTKKEGNAKIVSNTVVKMWELYGQETLKYIAALQNGNQRLLYTLFMFFILGGAVVMQIIVNGLPHSLKQFL